MEFNRISPQHDDVVTDISFDYYGKRFATCSLDKHIKVWTLNEEDSQWIEVDLPSAHANSIWRVSWAHPEFGQLIASCSEDCTVTIWEEQESITRSSSDKQDKWIKKATLSESKMAVKDVKFGPRHLGLKLASACADGIVRIYEATDVFSLNYWQLQDHFQAEDPENFEHGLTCLAWNECAFEPAMIAVGSSANIAAVWCLENSKWKHVCQLGEHHQPIHDIAWAPSMGRSYHMIATASRENVFQIHTLQRADDGSSLTLLASVSLPSHSGAEVWRVTWNATGTLLSTAAEDGSLSLWRRNFAGEWKHIQEVPRDSDKSRLLHRT